MFLDHVILSAAGRSAPHGALLAAAEGDVARPERRRFRALAPDQARGYLTHLVEDLLAGTADAVGPTGVHAYLLPCEAVFEAAAGKKSLVDAVEELRDAYFERPTTAFFSTLFGPVPDAVERHEPPPLEEAERLRDRRFGLYFDLLEDPDQADAPSKGGTRRRRSGGDA